MSQAMYPPLQCESGDSKMMRMNGTKQENESECQRRDGLKETPE